MNYLALHFPGVDVYCTSKKITEVSLQNNFIRLIYISIYLCYRKIYKINFQSLNLLVNSI